MNLIGYSEEIVKFIRDEVQKANAKGVIVGISGGVDSALVAVLAKLAFPNEHLAVWMPIDSSKLDYECSTQLVKECNLKNVAITLNDAFNEVKKALIATEINISQLALANTKARLRMVNLYSLAQSLNYLVLGTDNYVEWYIGYFTKYGDGGVDLLPIVNLLKSDVFSLAKHYGVPDIILNRAPTAGLWENQTDEAEIGVSYNEIDKYLLGEKVDPTVIDRVEYLHKISEHKRNKAPSPQKMKELKK